MPQQPLAKVENNFTKGLVTEYTGLNFPENAATDADNSEFGLVGDVIRRRGIDRELNYVNLAISRNGVAVNTYKWDNAGGDGNTQVMCIQTGYQLSFYRCSSSTVASPISAQFLVSTIDMSAYTASGGTYDPTLEATFTSGNGFLFVTHPSCDPFSCTYVAGVIVGTRITVKIRDFTGIPEIGTSVNTRPTTLSLLHVYNLTNQGWTAGNQWYANSSDTKTLNTGATTYTVQAGLVGVGLGTTVTVYYAPVSWPVLTTLYPGGVASGTVTAYAGTSMTVNITSVPAGYVGGSGTGWGIAPTVTPSYIATWNTATGNYPSNADVWWYFRNSTGVFDPATTISNVTLGLGNAPRGHYVMDAFSQQRTIVAGITTLTPIVTTARPTNSTWFQGRLWFTGVNAQQAATGNAPYYTWTENIYFSQTVVDNTEFGNCYQVNDPTSETLFDLLPTDGGVIKIQGCGNIFKLFPIQNGLLVFAANGVWFITGSQGIGFSANDYTITKISSIKSISSTSFVDVEGLPYFWNEDGIYAVAPQQGGGLAVMTQTYNTIDTYYAQIPLSSKKYARGDYDPINYTIKWVYKSTEAANINSRYEFNKILNYNKANKAFYPYTVSGTNTTINGINYVTYPGGLNTPPPCFKYLATDLSPVSLSFADEHDTNYVDWASDGVGINYESYFITGYRLHGQAQTRTQMPYIYVFSRTDEGSVAYKVQGLWDFASSGSSGRWSTAQIVNIDEPNYSMVFRRHRIRGQGLVLQLKLKSVNGEPFDFMGWSTYETVNSGV